jgi:hypothetical protein
VQLRVYLSTNTTITSSDRQVWSGSWSSFAAHGRWNNGTIAFTIPSNTPVGDYYVGWILTVSETEISGGHNNPAILVGGSPGFTRARCA